MSISLELTRIQRDKATIRAKLEELGLATSVDNLDTLADAIAGIVNRGAVNVEVAKGGRYTIPAGYHNGAGTVTGAGDGGNYSTQQKTATPTKQQQSVTPDDGYYALSSVIVEAIPVAYQNVSNVTAAAGDVLTGKIFVTSNGTETAGTMSNNGAVNKTLTGTEVSYTIPKGYHSGAGVVKIVIDTDKTITPTKSRQTVSPASGKVLGAVTVEPIPDAYRDITGVTATAGDVLDGKKIIGANGAEVEGSMPNNGSVSATIDGLSTLSATIPAGYTTGGTVSLTNDIETALAAI